MGVYVRDAAPLDISASSSNSLRSFFSSPRLRTRNQQPLRFFAYIGRHAKAFILQKYMREVLILQQPHQASFKSSLHLEKNPKQPSMGEDEFR